MAGKIPETEATVEVSAVSEVPEATTVAVDAPETAAMPSVAELVKALESAAKQTQQAREEIADLKRLTASRPDNRPIAQKENLAELLRNAGQGAIVQGHTVVDYKNPGIHRLAFPDGTIVRLKEESELWQRLKETKYCEGFLGTPIATIKKYLHSRNGDPKYLITYFKDDLGTDGVMESDMELALD